MEYFQRHRIRREISELDSDFAWALERDAKKQKKTKESSAPSTLQGVIENLRLAYQELSIIIDLINTPGWFLLWGLNQSSTWYQGL
uniref:Uncharacterized protein n=1 Tax=Chenopodium quinoa TaxID=63459 RepID=A0A803N6B2_CHEQI